MRVSIVAVLAMAAVMAACAGAPPATSPPTPSPAPTLLAMPKMSSPDAVDAKGTCFDETLQCTLMDVATWRSVPLTPAVACSGVPTVAPQVADQCQVIATLYGPTDPGQWPLFVVVAGATAPPDAKDSYIDDFAKQLAGRGAVVLRDNWRRDPSQGGGYPASFGDIACAIGVARKIGPQFGADPASVVLVGHSSGGWASSIVGLTPAPFVPAAGSCNETAGSLRPDAWAAMAPALSYTSAGFIGGDATQEPEAWAAADVFALANNASDADRLPVTLIQGVLEGPDAVARTREFQAALVQAGFDSTLLEEPDADHPGVLSTLESLDALMELADRSNQ
jgi:acetyl esterase/lipase